VTRYIVGKFDEHGERVYWVSRGVWSTIPEDAARLTGHEASVVCGNLNDMGIWATFERAVKEK
jgi:hypothetical protein